MALSRPSPRTVCRASALFAAAVALGAAAPAHAAFLTNGDFETVSGNDFDAWAEDGPATVSNSPTVLAGNHSAKVTRATGSNQFAQSIADPDGVLTDWVFETDLVVLPHENSRSFQINLYHTASTSANNINLIVKTVGSSSEIWIYNQSKVGGAGFESGFLVDAIDFSNDVNLDGDLTDSGDVLAVNTLRITGHYGDTTPTYDIAIVDSDDVTHVLNGVAKWQNTAPVSGAKLTRVAYQAGNLEPGGYYFIVDNASVAVPEPASLALVAVGAGLALSRRR